MEKREIFQGHALADWKSSLSLSWWPLECNGASNLISKFRFWILLLTIVNGRMNYLRRLFHLLCILFFKFSNLLLVKISLHLLRDVKRLTQFYYHSIFESLCTLDTIARSALQHVVWTIMSLQDSDVI